MSDKHYNKFKRLFDVLSSCIGLIVLSPLLLVISLMIYWQDRGSVFYFQKRVGIYRQEFTLIKFRTMKNNNITRLGKWLRATGIDELPQLINVLKNEMSIVGPRPLTKEDVARLGWNEYRYQYRWNIFPGITGLAQLYGGYGARMSCYLDRMYSKRKSFMFDLLIVFYSVFVNVIGKKHVRSFLRR